MIETFWLLLVAHAFTDVVGQTERMELNKHRKNGKVWFYWLLAHGLINGFGVYAVTQDVMLGIGETSLHMLTDYLKCEKIITLEVDQFIHLLSKLLWASLCQNIT